MKTTFLRLLGPLALVTCAVLPAAARAQGGQDPAAPPPPAFAAPSGAASFGATGQYVLSLVGNGDEYAFLHDFDGPGWEIGLHPALDYFIANRISIGGLVGFRYGGGGDGPGDTRIDLGIRAGFYLDIQGPIGFWPTAGIHYWHHRHDRTSDNHAALAIFAPFLYHLAPHLFIGIGPSFDAGLKDAGNSFGLDAVLGGWF